MEEIRITFSRSSSPKISEVFSFGASFGVSLLSAFRVKFSYCISIFCLFLQVPAATERVQNVTVKEGKNVAMECKVTTGSPPLTVFWENAKSGQVMVGKLLNITRVTRYQTEYRCIVNNTCGSDSSTVFIDVQCKNTSST